MVLFNTIIPGNNKSDFGSNRKYSQEKIIYITSLSRYIIQIKNSIWQNSAFPQGMTKGRSHHTASGLKSVSLCPQ